MTDDITISPDKAAEILVAHQRMTSSACLCGWAELGRSHAQHQVEMLKAGADR